jgi:hypothetical protein
VTTLNFDAFWRDHGVSKGLKGLGSDAETSTKHVKTLGDHGKQLVAGFAGFAAAKLFDSFIQGARESNAISRITEQRVKVDRRRRAHHCGAGRRPRDRHLE